MTARARIRNLIAALALGLFAISAGTAVPAPARGGPAVTELSRADRKWVRKQLASLSLEEKAAQMIMIRAFGRFTNVSSESHRGLVAEVKDLGVGGVVVFDSDLESIPPLLNRLQRAADLPLLVAADMERGMAFRVRRGTTPLPYNMAVGATRSEEAARFMGEVTAREGRALGIHWAFAPVADVNNNPSNPVINLRSFGEDPDLVARMSAAFVEGARSGGILTTAKHFPGHGDTAIDSHVELPTVERDRAGLDQVELLPFDRTISAGVDSVMLGHIAVPAVDPTGAPATLSPTLAVGLLRDEMGFDGLIVTDAMEMGGVGPVWSGAAAVQAVAAGADVVLLPPDTRVAIQSLVRAVEEGQLSEERIDHSVERILETKARLGLRKKREVDPESLAREVRRPEDLERARKIAQSSITVVRNDGDVLPLRAEKPLEILHLVMSNNGFDAVTGWIPSGELGARGIPSSTRVLGTEVSEESTAEILSVASDFSHVVVSAFVRVPASSEESTLSPSHSRLLTQLIERDVPVIVVSFGSPYLLVEQPDIPVYVCAYGWAKSSQRGAISALFGETDIGGKLPVSLPGMYPFGHGLEIPRHEMGLPRVGPEDAGVRAEGLEDVDRVVQSFVEQKAFPGATLAVGYQGQLVHFASYGRLSYEDESRVVGDDTLYDLASLTKVVATTTAAMILVDEGRLDLEARVQSFLPGFTGSGKEAVTVRHLLTHSSGVDWWAPLYEELEGKAAYVARIQAMDLVYEPGTKAVYSDLGLILLGEILERVAGVPLDRFVHERVFEPLSMTNTLFRPGAELHDRIAPTEQDPWRGRMVRGEVHDENAFALGGVAPHAGLFSTAGDLARFVQMIVNRGVFEHHRIVSRATVEQFTQRAGVPDSSRALGWDTKSVEGSSAGTLFSPNSFGHTGFTGTSIWIDPERELFVILLTNRVHPTRENKLIREVRPAVADAVVRALPELPETDVGVVHVGLERIAAGEVDILDGKKVGLIVHAASVTNDGDHAIDVLLDRGIDVARLFTPEHGLRGRAAAGEHVASGNDPASGLPVVSLYGDQPRPERASLAGLDALVFDLQGAGVRFYTYVSTLILTLEAAAEADLEFVVLDRPNPLGGERVEGPVSVDRTVVPASFVNMAPGPLVHGLTLGEMARFVNARLDTPARLTVVPMDGWKREMTWADTGRRWVSPSPNLRSAEAALAYPGVALLEATNVSEGRGTTTPFLVFGAPWLTPLEGLGATPGFALEPVKFTPAGSPGAPNPKHVDEECQGLRVWVTDAPAAEPYRLGIELLRSLSSQAGFEWRRGGEALTWLLGTPRIFEDLKAGKSVDEVLDADREDHVAWRDARVKVLLY